jgi:hypothetical protein
MSNPYTPFEISEFGMLPAHRQVQAIDHLISHVLNPTEGSPFGEQNAHLTSQSRTPSEIISGLMQAGYGSLIAFHEESVAGHVAYQAHGNSHQYFSIFTEPPFQKTCLLLHLVHASILHTRMKGIHNAHFNGGGHDIGKILERYFSRRQENLGISLLPNFQVKIH